MYFKPYPFNLIFGELHSPFVLSLEDDGDTDGDGVSDDDKKSYNEVVTFSTEVGDFFCTKKEGKDWLFEMLGDLKSINPTDTVTEGW